MRSVTVLRTETYNLVSNDMANLHIVELSENKVYTIIIILKNDFVVNKLFTALSSRDGIVSDINISVSAARY